MAIKKIAFSTQVNRAYSACDTLEEIKSIIGTVGHTDELHHQFKVFDFDYDPAETYLLALQLNAAGDGLVNPEAGKTIDEQRTAVENRDITNSMNLLKRLKTGEIKSQTAIKVKELKWKESKARDADAIAGNTNALRAYYQEREDVRQAGNAAEGRLAALTSFNDVQKFNPPDEF